MSFDYIRTYNYRNLVDQEIFFDSPEIFLVGENGQGKTNFLEALYLICYGASFKPKNEQILCKSGKSEFSVISRYSNDNNVLKITYKQKDQKRNIIVNDKLIKDRKNLIKNIPCIIFTHDDFNLVKGAPERRRFFLNQTLSLYDPSFVDVIRKYNKILHLRNDILKSRTYELLDVYDQQLSFSGLELQRRRYQTICDFNDTFNDLFRKISGLPFDLTIRYQPSWSDISDSEDIIKKHLERKRDSDIRMSTTTSGPHRDRILFIVNKKNYASIASTGQQRLISLILRVAQANFFTRKTGIAPVLLLDDVLLELDPQKRERFIGFLPESRQSIFTFLPDERYTKYVRKEASVFKVKEGELFFHGKSSGNINKAT